MDWDWNRYERMSLRETFLFGEGGRETGKDPKKSWYFGLGLKKRIDIFGTGMLGRKRHLSKGPEAGKG